MHHAPTALLSLLFAGCVCENCAPPVQVDNHGFGDSYDMLAADGLRFRNDPPKVVLSQDDFQLVDAAYKGTEACAAIDATGPLIVVTSSIPDQPIIGGGHAYFDTGLLLLTPTAIRDVPNFAGNPATGRLPGTSILRHEFVHYLLAKSGFPDAQNAAHQSPLFVRCAGL